MGGPKAPLSAQENVASMRRLIDTPGPKDSGKFYSCDGRRISLVNEAGAFDCWALPQRPLLLFSS
jgi:hypothetical protein